jgi:hypothetical protein
LGLLVIDTRADLKKKKKKKIKTQLYFNLGETEKHNFTKTLPPGL